MTEHKHAEVLRAIADGKKVQYTTPTGTEWYDFDPDCMLFSYPMSGMSWRVKPEPKPDFKTYLTVRKGYTGDQTRHRYASDTVCFTFDGETGNLKSVEMLK